MLLAIILATVAVSIYCFSRPHLFQRLALSPYDVVHGRQLHRLLTHMFVHAGWPHLLINMLVFYSFAEYMLTLFWQLSEEGLMPLPTLHFLMLYFGGGITAALLGLHRHRNDPHYLSVGASGGVASVLFASIFFNPWQPIYLFAIIPLPGLLLGIAYLVYSWVRGIHATDRVDHWAHFWGAIYGLLYPLLINPKFLHIFLAQLRNVPWI